MTQLTPEQLAEFKRMMKETKGIEMTDAEAMESAYNLIGFMKVIVDVAMEDERRKLRLKDEPKGFHLTDGKTYTCCVCYDSISNEKTWYDQSGLKCLLCQRAINRRVIPRSVCTNRDSWVPAWMITRDLGIQTSTIQKYIRTGELKVRNILNDQGKVHYQVFLLKENQEFIKNHQPISS